MKACPDSPVYALLKNPSMLDFPGRLAAVFFISGCNFRCGFCHNPGLMRSRQKGIPWDQLEATCRKLADNWVDGAVIMGGEPTVAPDLIEVIQFFRSLGWAIKLDTNGSRPDALEEYLPLVSYVAMDVKAGPSGYAGLTGFGDMSAIRRSIALLRENARDYEFRTTVLESFHTDAQMKEIGELIRGGRRYVLQPFVPRDSISDPALQGKPRTSRERLLSIRNLLAGCAEEILIRGDD